MMGLPHVVSSLQHVGRYLNMPNPPMRGYTTSV